MRKYEIQLSDNADNGLIKLQEALVSGEAELEPFLRTHITPDVLLEAGLCLMMICAGAAKDLPDTRTQHMLQGFVRGAITAAVTNQYPEALDGFLATIPEPLRDIMRVVMNRKPDTR